MTRPWLLGLLCLGFCVPAPLCARAAELHDLSSRGFAAWHGSPHLEPGGYREASEEQRDGWVEETRAHWSFADGVFTNDGQGPYLTTNQDFGDYELRLDYRIDPDCDSGVYLRGCPQVQIWDPDSEQSRQHGAEKGSGGLWNNSPGAAGKDPLVRADNPVGQWNQLRIVQVGERTSVWLNDKLVVDFARMENYWDREAPLPRTGPIQLQTHGGTSQWRNISVREIGPTEANQWLAMHEIDGFESIFDGNSLAGWQGAVDNYEVVDGAIRCRKGHGGTLYTEESYSDFVVRLRFRLPPGGNNGLAIRYPGEGDPAYTGMTELQVLDTPDPRFSGLDLRQVHGSAYGMVGAARGYLRSPGEWNFQQVTVDGSRIVVELNGTRILDADLSQVTEFMGDRPHPGKDRAEGHFGFAGHNDPVAFADIQIRRIDSE